MPLVPSPDASPRPRASGADGAVVLRGIVLRSFLVLVLHAAASELTVRELVAALERHGHAVVGRPSKAVSDALRWEVRWGRVVRVGRGRYRVGRLSRQTAWTMRRRVAAVRAGAATNRRGGVRGDVRLGTRGHGAGASAGR